MRELRHRSILLFPCSCPFSFLLSLFLFCSPYLSGALKTAPIFLFSLVAFLLSTTLADLQFHLPFPKEFAALHHAYCEVNSLPTLLNSLISPFPDALKRFPVEDVAQQARLPLSAAMPLVPPLFDFRCNYDEAQIGIYSD